MMLTSGVGRCLSTERADALPRSLLTGSSHTLYVIPRNTFHVQAEELAFCKCTGGTRKAEYLLWSQELAMLESNTHPPTPKEKKASARFLEPDLLVNWILALSLHIHGIIKGNLLRTCCQDACQGIGTDRWGSYWLPFNFCLFNHQKNVHTLLNGTNSPAGGPLVVSSWWSAPGSTPTSTLCLCI